jgi:two-component system, cell cycle response regulator
MGKKVLTIDDSNLVRSIISKHLIQFSVGMVEAENGEAGIARARESVPDLILLDYNMPVMDGYHTLIELKTDPALKSIPVIMVTTETSKETVIKLLKLGLDDYIAKPFTRELLLRKINPILKLFSGDEVPPDSATVSPAVPAMKEKETTNREEIAVTESATSILVVDDKSSIRELMKEYLSEQFQLMTVDCGRAALAAFAQRSFDHIFLDLSLPDMSGFDVLSAYLKDAKNGASEKKVIAMTLRSALQDIHRASEAGIQVVLFKPFTCADVVKAIEQSTAGQKELSAKKLHYLTASGKIMTLECPAQKSSRFRFFAESLNSSIPREIEEMADGGIDLLIIKIGEGFLSNRVATQNFLKLMQLIQQMSLTVRFVASSAQSRDELKKHSETANIPTDVSMECALSSVAC